jgi:anti-sigma B factor antagonist
MGASLSMADDRIEIRITGELSALSAPALRALLDHVVAVHPPEVTVNLSELALIDSSGVAAIVSLYKRLHDVGGEMQVIGVHDQPSRIFRLLGLDRVFAR